MSLRGTGGADGELLQEFIEHWGDVGQDFQGRAVSAEGGLAAAGADPVRGLSDRDGHHFAALQGKGE